MKIAIHLHLYYLEMWQDFEPLLGNLAGYEYDLFVTLVKNDENTIGKVLRFNKDAEILIVKNRGYDVGPFFYFLKKIDLDKYDYVIKLHSKNKSNKINLNARSTPRGYWFKLLAGSLLGSKGIVKKNFFELQNDEKLGMIGSQYLISGPTIWCKDAKQDITDTMNLLGFEDFVFQNLQFVAGTMFIAKSSVLKVLQRSNFSIDDFPPTNASVKYCTLAHVMERIFGAIVMAQGYKICGFGKNSKFEVLSFFRQIEKILRKIRKFLFQKLTVAVSKIFKNIKKKI